MEDAARRQNVHNISLKMIWYTDENGAEVKALETLYADNVKFLCTRHVQSNFEHAHGKATPLENT